MTNDAAQPQPAGPEPIDHDQPPAYLSPGWWLRTANQEARRYRGLAQQMRDQGNDSAAETYQTMCDAQVQAAVDMLTTPSGPWSV